MPKKLTELNETTIVSGSAITYVIDDPNSPTSKKVTIQNLVANVTTPLDILMIQVFS